MEVRGQLHVPAALTLEKQSLIPIGQEAGWDQEAVWTRWRREKIHYYPCQVLKPGPDRSLVTILTELPRMGFVSECFYTPLVLYICSRSVEFILILWQLKLKTVWSVYSNLRVTASLLFSQVLLVMVKVNVKLPLRWTISTRPWRCIERVEV